MYEMESLYCNCFEKWIAIFDVTNLILVQKEVLYSGSRIYNHLPLHIKILSNDLKHFKSKLKSSLIEHTLYSIKKFY
jgi:hypothetical protein